MECSICKENTSLREEITVLLNVDQKFQACYSIYQSSFYQNFWDWYSSSGQRQAKTLVFASFRYEEQKMTLPVEESEVSLSNTLSRCLLC